MSSVVFTPGPYKALDPVFKFIYIDVSEIKGRNKSGAVKMLGVCTPADLSIVVLTGRLRHVEIAHVQKKLYGCLHRHIRKFALHTIIMCMNGVKIVDKQAFEESYSKALTYEQPPEFQINSHTGKHSQEFHNVVGLNNGNHNNDSN